MSVAGEIVDQSTAMVPMGPGPEPAGIAAVMQAQGVGDSVDVVTSYDPTTPEGAGFLARAMACEADEKSKMPYYGGSMAVAAYTSRVVTSWHDRTEAGKVRRAAGKQLIRTVIELVDGTLVVSCSTYVYQSLRIIHSAHPDMSVEHPVECRLVRAGTCDKVVDVKASRPRRAP